MKKGFNFTLMVVGESGLGKSTLINTLFNSDIFSQKKNVELSNEIPKTISIQEMRCDIEENGVKLRLSVIDTPGFGDFVNNEDSWRPILENIEARFSSFLEQENRINRKKIMDTRVHACLYFIAPTGHSLKSMDVEFMKYLHDKVNLIPVIAKSDTMSADEILSFKARILSDISSNDIRIFMPQIPEDVEDQESIMDIKSVVDKIPFAVIGSSTEVQTPDGRKVRGRKYPWGIVEGKY
jgi:septin 7